MRVVQGSELSIIADVCLQRLQLWMLRQRQSFLPQLCRVEVFCRLVLGIHHCPQLLQPAVKFSSAMENGVASRPKREAKWLPPQPSTPEPQLKLYNSLTRRNDVFIPREGRKVQWYICGPTVYDSAHMGHARAYISFDILRRILHSYFNYDIKFVMNVTDIDDKIIKRARQTYLIDRYMEPSSLSGKKYSEIIDDMMAALRLFGDKWKAETNEDKKKMYQTMAANVGSAVTELEAALKAQDATKMDAAKTRLLKEGRDVLSDWLDQCHGANCTDHSIFNTLSRRYEEEFHSDMASLNVLPADVLTRVSEFVPEIIRFIEKIIANGYAYEANGSVYFDTEKFDAQPKHHYAKLVPEAFGCDDTTKQQDSLREGEGELSVGEERLKEKRGPNDFALWKASKAGEPFWDSPWGQGRPGWHIECSVMASEVCGEHLDIHAGGFDLKFPHHDNEIAQTEAHFCSEQWVNYFLHAGTLRIAGMKMSKSLKNFITIKQALQQYTARQIRLLFLLHNWSECLDYSTSTMERALQFEKMSNEFFLIVKHYLRTHFNPKIADSYVKFGESERLLDERFAAVKQQVHSALCDNVDTRSAMESVRELIGQANVYIGRVEAEKRVPNCLLLKNVATYMTRLFRIFGAVPEATEIGFVDQSAEGSGTKEEEVLPYLTALAQFREKIRSAAINTKNKEILEECDVLRDSILPDLGVRMEDKDGHTVIKLADRDTLLREKEQKERLAAEKKSELERKRVEAAAKEALKRLPPSEMFRGRLDEFSAWDDRGIPTHDAKGVELSKGQRKKLEKLWETQEKKLKAEQNGTHSNGVDR